MSMDTKEKAIKKPMSNGVIFKVMLYITYIVAAVFLVKNVLGGSVSGMIAIGTCLVVYTAVLLGMRAFRKNDEQLQYVASIGIVLVVFIISLYSGDFYSDDFGLYIATIGLSGMYLRPKYTITQIILGDIMLALQYVIHPEKADPLSQYIMCMAIFTLGGFMFYLVIKRGHAYIEMSKARAEEAERLLESLKQIGEELERNVENSTAGVESLREANIRLNRDADELKQGSVNITQGAREVADTCDDVHDKIEETKEQVGALTEGVHNFENALSVNRKNMEVMNRQMESVQATMNQANKVFQLLEQQMQEISAVTEQMNSISASTNMLALNASIEAARAGQSGAGFAVVASKVQELAIDSNKCSDQVVVVVGQMQTLIQETTKQLADSDQEINASLDALNGLQGGFDQLTEQFDSLYQNIEAQNSNITQVNAIFEQLKGDIAEMSQYSEENQGAVEDIADALIVYKESMDKMVNDAQHVQELSTDMLNLA